MRITGDLYLRSVVATSTIDFTDAEIDGNFRADHAQLRSRGDSLILAAATIGQSALFGETYSAGMIRATRATINSDLTFTNTIFANDYCNGLKAGYAVIKGNLWWAPASVGKHTELDLVGASVGTFHNYDVKGWPIRIACFSTASNFRGSHRTVMPVNLL